MSIATPRDEVEESVSYLVRVVRAQGRSDDIIPVLIRETADTLTKRQSVGGGLTEDQAAFLVESGTFTEQGLADIEAEVARGDLSELERHTRLDAVAATLSAAEVAARLQIDQSRVRHRQAKGGLSSFVVGGKRRYPMWQFTDIPGQPVLPGLPALVTAFPDDMHPASVQNFMATPQEDLIVDGRRATPAEWLLFGGDVQDVVDILDSFLQS